MATNRQIASHLRDLLTPRSLGLASRSWVLSRLDDAVGELLEDKSTSEAGTRRVSLVAHSAGGWLARAWLARFPPWAAAGRRGCQYVRTLVTLGSPHHPPVPGGGGGGGGPPDPTGGALNWVDTNFPGAFYAGVGVKYVCVAGQAVVGAAGEASRGEKRSLAAYAATSYATVSGRSGDGVVGDGVVPLEWAQLDGAKQIILPGAFHSMSAPGTFDDPAVYPWYGSAAAIDAWAGELV